MFPALGWLIWGEGGQAFILRVALLEIASLRWWWNIIPQCMISLSTEFETDWTEL
jgi:hypothetical protein